MRLPRPGLPCHRLNAATRVRPGAGHPPREILQATALRSQAPPRAPLCVSSLRLLPRPGQQPIKAPEASPSGAAPYAARHVTLQSRLPARRVAPRQEAVLKLRPLLKRGRLIDPPPAEDSRAVVGLSAP